MKRADCRKCIYFIPIEKMSDDLIAKAEEWVEKNRPGEEVLGWCKAYRRPVTYFEGSCPRFTKKVMNQLKLDDYVRR